MKNNKKEFIIKYYFDGQGEATVKAKNKKEAEDMFYDGRFGEAFGSEKEWGESYTIDSIKPINN